MNNALKKNLLRADLYRVLALGFEEPGRENLETLRGILADLLQPGVISSSIEKNLESFLEQTMQNPDVLSAEYYRLFGTHVHCPSSEGSYQQVERGPIIGDISAFYEAFQMKVIELKGPPDSLKMELGFMSFMALKTAYALEHGLQEELAIVTEAQKKFLSSHLGRWIKPFVTKLNETSANPYYQSLAKLLEMGVEEDITHLGASPAPLPSLDFQDEGDVCCSLGPAGSKPAGMPEMV